MSPSRRLSPDRALAITLNATVARDFFAEIPRDEAIQLLRERAAGRSDLLARAAGDHLGGFLAHSAISPASIEFTARLISAGADLGPIPGLADAVRAAASAPGY